MGMVLTNAKVYTADGDASVADTVVIGVFPLIESNQF